MKPILETLIIEKHPEGEVTKSGIILTGTSASVIETHQKARVLSCGCGKKKQDEPLIKEGSVILFQRDHSADIEVEGKEITILKYSSVIAII